ncbi:NAD(P)-dependent oxidoreductase [Vibrio cholerae]|uniref:NAD-dependent epimerase/dehydratase family protein n=1 Tax=Vibrio cholerae TaxID=666 RepID=UPI0018F05DED|nr:NAD(P)-dependent oxidoreductase [Vibrio cholerae]MBJ6879701.1 NAD(P)-dependent oxidoreductase [Vibrio cholerae]MBJ6883408.1 NAD(P)-dependent oxidoreductase [Vibrio cholerae]MBJ6890767.1 NAD(P)-dependent oxidoreductase [Vibrio cholerae]
MYVDPHDLELIADKLTTDFDFYRNKKIFLTGGTGFFGKWLLEAFIYLNQNYGLNVSVTILSRSPEKFNEDFPKLFNHHKFKFVQGDVRSFPSITEEFDLIIHAATETSSAVDRENSELMHSTIMDGARRICEFAENVSCKRILYTSSGAAYGPQPEGLSHIPETFLVNPLFNRKNAYASAKLESENFFKEHSPCDVVIARCFAFAGPYLPLDGAYAFGNFINDVRNSRAIEITSSGQSVRSYLYAADLVIWLLRSLAVGKNKETYNIGSDQGITLKSLAEKIAQDPKCINVYGDADVNVTVYVPNINKAKSELDLDVYTSIDDAIINTMRFHSII